MDLFTRNASLKSLGALNVAFSHGNSRIEFARSGWDFCLKLKSRMVLPERVVMDVVQRCSLCQRFDQRATVRHRLRLLMFAVNC